MDGQLVDVWDFEWQVKQLTARLEEVAYQIEQLTVEQSELRKYIRVEYEKYETFHPHADAMRQRFPWLR